MTRRLHNWRYRDVTKFLTEHGFEYYEPYKGSHERWAKLKEDGPPERIVEVNFTNKTYPISTLKIMIRQSGVDEAEWIKWANS